MARKLRVQYPGAIYHVMNRGDRREAIFKDDQNRARFRDETELEHAEKIIQSRLKKLGWKEDDLARIAKGRPEKVKLALDLRKDTTSTIKWIAARLHMGSWTYLNHLLYWQRKHKSD